MPVSSRRGEAEVVTMQRLAGLHDASSAAIMLPSPRPTQHQARLGPPPVRAPSCVQPPARSLPACSVASPARNGVELLSDHHQWHAADEDEALQGRLPRIPRAAIAAAPTRPPHHTTIDLTAADSQALQELQAPLVVPSPHTQRQRHRRPTRQHAPQQDDDESEPSAPALPQLRHPPSITPLPKHVAVVMDGNARWAARQGQPTSFGHEAGVRAFRGLVANCASRGIQALTAFAFSRENFQRPAAEVDFFMRLFERTLAEQVDELHAQGVRLVFVGERQRLPASLVASMERAERLTEGNAGMLLSVAVAYGASHDLAAAARRIAALAVQGQLQPDMVDEKVLAAHMSTAVATQQVGPVDLLIRTSGEQRLSNFVLLEAAYAEIFFTDVCWPAFGERDLVLALEAFATRKRRFGRRQP